MKGYNDYKNSGVSWIGEIPENWLNVRLKLISSITKGKKPSKDYENSLEGLLPYLSMEYLRNKTEEPIYADPNEKNIVLVDEGDILILWDGSKAGEIVRAKKGVLSSTMAKIEIYDNRFDANYLNYLLQLGEKHIQANTIGMGIPHVNGNVLKDLMMLLPTSKEQTQIAAFLDYKTNLIDATIEKKKRLIELLKEKRQAVINEAVTKGLNPNVPMKDSGVEWLGEIPEHWKFQKAKRNTYMKGRIGWQGLKQEEFIDEGPYLITGMNFKDGVIRWDEVYHITKERYDEAPEIQLKNGDVLMTKDGTIGKLLYVDNLPGPASLNSHLLVLRCIDNSYIPKYLYYQLMTNLFSVHVELNKTGTTFFGITQEAVGRFKMLLPPVSEQQGIVDYIENQISIFDRSVNKIELIIENLKAYRQSLISEAVTGKIDVRDWQIN